MDSGAARKGLRMRRNVHSLHSTAIHGAFAGDVSMSLNEGHTLTCVALQAAFQPGFGKVALVGCDHGFAATGPANKVVTAEGPDPNHFDPSYFAGGMQWQLSDLIESGMARFEALRAYEEAGRHLYNSTEGGRLEILPRTPLTDFLDE